jgi:MFS transporter, DHA1 family, tetracycline resistance protein
VKQIVEKALNQRWPLVIIFFTVFIDLIGFGIVFPLISYYAENQMMTGTQIGIFLGAYSLMQFIFAPVLGRLSDRIGRRPVLLASLFGTAISYIMLGLANSFWLFLLSRTLDGISGSTISVAQAYVADITAPAERTKRLGMVIGAAHGLGFALGPALGSLLLFSNNLSLPYFVAGAVCFVNAVVAIFLLPESLKLRQETHRVGFRTFSVSYLINQLTSPSVGILILIYAVMILAFSMMEATFSLLAKNFFQISPSSIYTVFIYLGVVLTLVQGGLIRPLIKVVGEVWLIISGLIVMALGLYLLPQHNAIWWIYLTTGLLAIGQGFCSPCLTSLISQRSSASEQGERLGAAQSLASLARFFGPLIGGAAFHHLSLRAPYLLAASVVLGVFFVSLSLLRLPNVATETLDTSKV